MSTAKSLQFSTPVFHWDIEILSYVDNQWKFVCNCYIISLFTARYSILCLHTVYCVTVGLRPFHWTWVVYLLGAGNRIQLTFPIWPVQTGPDHSWQILKRTTITSNMLTKSLTQAVMCLDLSDCPKIKKEKPRFTVTYSFHHHLSSYIIVLISSCVQTSCVPMLLPTPHPAVSAEKASPYSKPSFNLKPEGAN